MEASSTKRIGVDELALSDTMLLSFDDTMVYELIDQQLAETVAQAQRRLVRRKLVNTDARPVMSSSIFGAEQRIVSRSARSPSSLGAMGKKHPRPCFSRVNEATIQQSTI